MFMASTEMSALEPLRWQPTYEPAARTHASKPAREPKARSSHLE